MVFLHHAGVCATGLWDWGQMGVRLFFVLSGYLVSLSFWKPNSRAEGPERKTLPSALLPRFSRLYPALLLGAGASVLFGLAPPTDLLWHLTFLSNFKMAAQGWFDLPTAHLWSLSVTAQFYVVWTLLLLTIPHKKFPLALIGAVATGILYRLLCFELGVGDLWRWVMLPASLDTFALGAALAWIQTHPKIPLKSPPMSPPSSQRLLLLALVGVLWTANRMIRTTSADPILLASSDTLEGLIGLLLLYGISSGSAAVGPCGSAVVGPCGSVAKRVWGVLSFGPLCRLGQMSYGVFIYHLPCFVLMESLIPSSKSFHSNHPFGWGLLALALVASLAYLSSMSLERPILKWARQRRIRPPADEPLRSPPRSNPC